MANRTEERETQDDSRRFRDTRHKFWAIIRYNMGAVLATADGKLKHHIRYHRRKLFSAMVHKRA